MNTLTAKSGRPRTVDRAKTIDIAMRAYWERGADAVSVNEISKLAEVSKPSLYREFGSEDGLMAAALGQFAELSVAPLLALLRSDAPTDAILDQVALSVVEGGKTGDLPAGCMVTPMFAMRSRFGDKTEALVSALQRDSLAAYQAFAERLDREGRLPSHHSPRDTALFLNASVGMAMMSMKQGFTPDEVAAMLRVAFAPFRD